MWAVPGSQPNPEESAHHEAAWIWDVLRSAKMLSSYTLTAFLPIWFARRNLQGSKTLEEPVSGQHINARNAPSYSESFSCYIFQVDSCIFMDSGYTNDAYAFWNALAVSVAGLLSVCLGSIIGPPSRCRDGGLFCLLAALPDLASFQVTI